MSSTPTRIIGPAQLTGAAATLYTTPASTITVLRHIHVSNPSGVAIGLTMSIGADAAGTRLFDGFSIPAGSEQDFFFYIPLAAAEIVQGFASTASVLVITAGADVRTP